MKRYWLVLAFCLSLAILWQCASEDVSTETSVAPGLTYDFPIPEGFPAPVFPEDNEMTAERIALGRRLFFEPALSIDSTISCGSCHIAAFAMGDSARISVGVEGRVGERNAPPLFNLAWQSSFMRDAGVPTLEMQVLAPVGEHVEMGFNINEAGLRLARDSSYAQASRATYGRAPDPYVITRALAAYQRTFISGNSPYDQYQRGDKTALSEEAQRGLMLFNGERLNCSACHGGFNFSDGSLQHNGLYLAYQDTGRARITMRSKDAGFFRVPSLRNIAVTGPYMHDGSVETLAEVLAHYENGGAGHPSQSTLVQGFSLSEAERGEVLAFLKSLTDQSFLSDPNLLKPDLP